MAATVIDPVRARAAEAPDWPGLVLLRDDGGREVITAAELWTDVARAAAGLRRAGIRPDDVIVVMLDLSRELIAVFLGAMAAGAVPTIVATASARVDAQLYHQRIETLLRNAGAAAVIVSAATEPHALGLPCRIIRSDTLADADGGDVPHDLAGDRLAFIQYTSGSGGVQKGVAHTHAGMLRYIESKRVGLPLAADDVIVNWTPLYHDQGLLSGLLAPLVIGFRTVMMSPQRWVRQPGLLLQCMHEYGGTLCYMPNFALNHCVRAMRESDVRELDLRRWRLLLLGGEPVRADSLRAFSERFAPQGFRESALRAGYGMAEMVEGITASLAGPPRVDWISTAALQREGHAVPVAPEADGSASFVSCGPTKDGAEMRIVDGDGVPLADRCVGEIEVRAEYAMREYYRRPDLTRAAFRPDGWFRTADRGYLVDGELYVVGRTSDMIIVGGKKLAPEEIEAAAERVPGVQPGRVVAFGVADRRGGTERVVLVCESAKPDDAEQCIAVERQLRRAVTQALGVTLGEVRFVERGWIVKTSSGKRARGENRAKYERELGEDAAP